MIKTFRSSDKKGTEGIDFGEEWYKRLLLQLQSTSDVVCLFTERSLDRPWILFEAGVAKGKVNTPVVGVALGVPLSRVSTGPFYQFMNKDDSEGAPWLYELAMEVYRAVKSGDAAAIEQEMMRLQRFSKLMMRGPFMEEFGFGGKESQMFFMEFPRMLEHMLTRTLEAKKSNKVRIPPHPVKER